MEIKSKIQSLKIQRHGKERIVTVELHGTITEDQEQLIVEAFHRSASMSATLDMEATPFGSICKIALV